MNAWGGERGPNIPSAAATESSNSGCSASAAGGSSKRAVERHGGQLANKACLNKTCGLKESRTSRAPFSFAGFDVTLDTTAANAAHSKMKRNSQISLRRSCREIPAVLIRGVIKLFSAHYRNCCVRRFIGSFLPSEFTI